MNVLIALSYGDRRALLNALRALPARPGRLAVWLLYALAVAGFVVVKTAPHARGTRTSPVFASAVDDLWVCGFGLVFGIVLASGTTQWLGVFSSRAEALILTRSEASPLIVASYLQVRAVGLVLVRGFARFAYFIVFGIPSGTTVGALAAQLCFFAAAGAAIASVALPRALARGGLRTAMIVAGMAIALAAAAPMVLDALRLLHLPETAALLLHAPAVHPGAILRALAGGDLRAVLIPLAVALLATASFALAARDAYPELYALSLANLEWRMRVRVRGARGASTPRAKAVRSAGGTRMRGAFALLWADGLMFARNVSPVLTAVIAVLALLTGAVVASVARHAPELSFGVLFGAGPGVAVAVASTTGVRLAPALRMPLFWLGNVALAARLAAWAGGAVWRDGVVLGLAATGYAAVAHDVRAPLLIFTGALSLLMLTRAVGVAVFALLPNRLDQHGPAVLIRALLSFALIVPPIAVGGVASAAFGFPLAAGILAAAAAAAAEAAALMVLAARHLAGRIDRLATA